LGPVVGSHRAAASDPDRPARRSSLDDRVWPVAKPVDALAESDAARCGSCERASLTFRRAQRQCRLVRPRSCPPDRLGVLKASLAELTTDENKGRAFALLPMTWAIGAALGPLIGGWCAPGGLADKPPVAAFPFLLPCLVSALFPLVGALVASRFLRETLPAKAADAPSKPAAPMLPMRELLTPQVRSLLTTYALLALQTISLAALLPLFAFTPIESGGLGFSTAAIGTAMRSVSTIRM